MKLRFNVPILALALGLALSLCANDLQWPSDAFAIWPLREEFPLQTSVVSWSDWLVFFNAHSREPGVRAILNEMAASGARAVWWRTFGGGHALYSSKVDGVTTGNYAGQGADYSTFNSLAEAVSYGHKLGLKVYAWYTPLEEAHGWAANVRSVYTDAHPEMSDYDNIGHSWQTPSMYYPQYRAYKLALGKEMLDCGVDGMIIDFERIGAPGRSNNWGYIPALLKEFNARYGRSGKPGNDDPDFIAFRNEFVAKFMREMAAESHRRGKEFAVMYQERSNHGVTAHCNAPGWYKEGFVDHVCVTNSWEWDAVTADLFRSIVSSYGTKPWPIQYGFYGEKDQLLGQARMLAAEGAENIVWFETTYLHGMDKYCVLRELACHDEATLTSPEYDFSQGGVLHVSGAVTWQLFLGDRQLGQGAPGQCVRVEIPAGSGCGRLVLKGRVADQAGAAGVGLFGEAVGADGAKVSVVTGRDWRAEKGALQTIGVMGVPPFLAPLDKEVR